MNFKITINFEQPKPTQEQIDLMEGRECTCGLREYPLHSCPYASDINGDYESKCDCCPYCEQQCAYDI